MHGQIDSYQCAPKWVWLCNILLMLCIFCVFGVGDVRFTVVMDVIKLCVTAAVWMVCVGGYFLCNGQCNCVILFNLCIIEICVNKCFYDWIWTLVCSEPICNWFHHAYFSENRVHTGHGKHGKSWNLRNGKSRSGKYFILESSHWKS